MLIFTLAMSTPGCCRLDAHLDVNDDALDGDQIFMTGLQELLIDVDVNVNSRVFGVGNLLCHAAVLRNKRVCRKAKKEI
jgi:hypothetical protein